MRKLPFNNESSPSERVAVHRNDERVRRGGTYHGIASGEASAPSGRFGAISRSTVIGAGGPQYPKLPPSSPWHSVVETIEPALGYSIADQPAVGEPFEIEQSAASQAGEGLELPPPAASPSGEQSSGGAGSGVDRPKGTIETAPPPSPRRKAKKS